MATVNRKNQSEAPVQISAGTKLLALSKKLAVPPTANQLTVVRYAPAAQESVLIIEPMSPDQVDAMLAETGIDAMLLARAFMTVEPNNQGLTPQIVYSLSPLFWGNGGAAANRIATVAHGEQIVASGLLSVLARASAGFVDHRYQLLGKKAGEVNLIAPVKKVPALSKAIMAGDGWGANGGYAEALLQGFNVTVSEDETGQETRTADLPALVVKATGGRKTAVEETFDPFADLDGWL